MGNTDTPAISDNYNENSSDPNPYVFPYFNNTAPLIYELIVTHFGSSNKNTSGACTRGDRRTIRRGVLARGFQSQCLARPIQASWTDSCGENSLHRICQLVHFSLYERIHGVSFPFTTNGQSILNMAIFNSKEKRNLTAAELALFVQKFLLEADPKLAHAVNNWGETPLHQFLSHCGFASNQTDDVDAINEILDEGTHFKLHFGCRDMEMEAGAKDAGKKTLPMLQFLDALLEANPDSICTPNYVKVLPLHEACTLSQFSNSPADYLAPLDIVTHFSMEEDELDLLRKKETMRSKGHSLIVQRLLDLHPTALMETDNMGRIPLFRAIQSMHCGADIAEILLREMELVLAQERYSKASATGSLSLLRMVIMGKSNPYRGRDGSIKGKDSQEILSPMEELWNIVLTPRNRLDPKSCEMSSQVASISQIIESRLNPFQRHVSTYRQTHCEAQMREHQVASLLVKQIGDIWEKAVHLILASYHGTIQSSSTGKKTGVVHAAVFCSVPRCILSMAVRLYPDELTKENGNGDTPLSILLSSINIHRSDLGWGTIENHGITNVEAMDMMQTVLWADPNAAAVVNRDGRLPLHLAIANGAHWSNGVEDIFLANPKAISIRDPITRLFPFMHASVSNTNTQPITRKQEEESVQEGGMKVSAESDSILTTVYELLRANPANLKIYNKTSAI